MGPLQLLYDQLVDTSKVAPLLRLRPRLRGSEAFPYNQLLLVRLSSTPEARVSQKFGAFTNDTDCLVEPRCSLSLPSQSSVRSRNVSKRHAFSHRLARPSRVKKPRLLYSSPRPPWESRPILYSQLSPSQTPRCPTNAGTADSGPDTVGAPAVTAEWIVTS